MTAFFLKRPELEAEISGPTTLLVQHSSHEELLEIGRRLGGHLTASVHGTENDLRDFADLITILEEKSRALGLQRFPHWS